MWLVAAVLSLLSICCVGIAVFRKIRRDNIPVFGGIGDFIISSSAVGLILSSMGLLLFAKEIKADARVLFYIVAGGLLLLGLLSLFKLLTVPFKSNARTIDALYVLFARVFFSLLFSLCIYGILVCGLFLYCKFFANQRISHISWRTCLLGLVPFAIVSSCRDYVGHAGMTAKPVDGSVLSRHRGDVYLSYAALAAAVVAKVLSMAA